MVVSSRGLGATITCQSGCGRGALQVEACGSDPPLRFTGRGGEGRDTHTHMYVCIYIIHVYIYT